MTDYQITLTQNGIQVKDINTSNGDSGTDLLVDIEKLQIESKTYNFAYSTLLSDNFSVPNSLYTGDLNYNLSARQTGSLATKNWVGSGNVQVVNLTAGIDGGNYLLTADGGTAALDYDFKADSQKGLQISFDLAPNSTNKTDQTVWGAISLGLSSADKNAFINSGVSHFGILFRGNGGIQAFDGSTDVTGSSNTWGGTGNDGTLHHFTLLLTDPTDGDPFNGSGQTDITVYADYQLIYRYSKLNGGYSNNYLNFASNWISVVDNLLIKKLDITSIPAPTDSPPNLGGGDFNLGGGDFNLGGGDFNLGGGGGGTSGLAGVNGVGVVTQLAENSDTTGGIKVADIAIADNTQGTKEVSLSGSDAANFEVRNYNELFFIGSSPDFETKSKYDVTVNVDDPTTPGIPDVVNNFTLAVANLPDQNISQTVSKFTSSTTDNKQGSLIYNLTGHTGDISTKTDDTSLNQTDALFHNLVGLYQVENANGAILDTLDLNNNGATDDLLNPGDVGYARTAITNSVNNFILQMGADRDPDKNTSATEFGDVLLQSGKLYAPFAIANGGDLIPTGGTLQDGINTFLAQNPNNTAANLSNFMTHAVAYFSFGSANPDGVEHLQNRGNNVFGFEDLPGNLAISDFDFNDAVFKFTFLS